MKNILVQLAAYNAWASASLLSIIDLLTEDQQRRTINSSFPSLYLTVQHLLGAERIWWQRFQPAENIIIPKQAVSDATFFELSKQLQQQDKEWAGWVAEKSEQDLQGELQYRNLKGEPFQQPVWEILLHLFNHGTYHRGQLVTMLRQLGVDSIPPTDFILWSRKG